jgi:hypothetical protein
VKKRALVLTVSLCAFIPAFARAQSTGAAHPNTATDQYQGSQAANADLLDDVTAARDYRAQVRQWLKQEDFSALELEAAKERTSKARFAGGAWKLHVFYGSVSQPGVPVPTDTDLESQIALLKRWVAAVPDSITARLALAHTYLNYAWNARGHGMANTVTTQGWQLFESRTEQAKTILDDARNLSVKCPEWFVAMMGVALHLNWTRPEFAGLFRDATAFEPEYFYYYMDYANYLQPKWDGKHGESAKMADDAATRVGGDQGDFLYFEIAGYVAARGNKPEIKQMSWDRIQAGYAALEKLYGSTYVDKNEFALMAVRFKDIPTAQKLFLQIGNHWSSYVWRTHQNYITYRAQVMTSRQTASN